MAMEDNMFAVFEVMPDGKRFVRFEGDSSFDCEVLAYQHKYDSDVLRAHSTLVVEKWD